MRILHHITVQGILMEFDFKEPGILTDDDLELILIERREGNPAKALGYPNMEVISAMRFCTNYATGLRKLSRFVTCTEEIFGTSSEGKAVSEITFRD